MVDKAQILNILPKRFRGGLEWDAIDFECLREIRIRIGQPIRLNYNGKEKILEGFKMNNIDVRDLKEIMEYVSHYSLFAYENELKKGFITIRGGHRIGVVGKTIIENNRVKNIKCISSINIRIAHEIKRCGSLVLPYLIKENRIGHTLIISPPSCGKTTLLRDLIRMISSGNKWISGLNVGVVDERSEIGGCYQGVPQNDLGCRTDILDACPKNEGMLMLIRSMSPDVLAIDEIGSEEEIHTIKYAMHCGCKILTTIHGSSLEEVKKKPLLESMIKEGSFERYVVLRCKDRIGEIERIYNERGVILVENLR